MTNDSNNDFDGAKARWQADYDNQLPNDATRKNRSGIEIKPIYTPDDWDGVFVATSK